VYSLSGLPRNLVQKISVQSDGCWIWTGGTAKKKDGRPTYGRVRWKGTMLYAHRVVYEILVGAIDDGLQLDHLCSVPGCVNPEHLEPVTGSENIKRARPGQNMVAAIKCFCGECKTCYQREYMRRYRAK
jgi:HNH endonuclease